MRYLFTITFLWLPFFLSATYPDSLKAVKNLKYSRELIEVGKIDSAALLTNEGLYTFRANNDLDNWIYRQRLLGRTWRNVVGNPQKSLDVFFQCLDNLWREVETTREKKSLAYLLADIAYTYDTYYRDLLRAKKYYLQAGNIFTDSLQTENFKVAKYIYTNLGNTYSRLRDSKNAERYLTKVKTISLKAKEWDIWGEACSDLGQIYSNHNKYEEAVNSFHEALAKKDSLSSATKCLLYTSLGLIYYHTEYYDKALKNTDKALKEYKSITGISEKKKDELRYQLYVNHGRIYKALKAYDLSRYNYTLARKLLNQSPGRDLALMNINFGRMFFEWGKLEQALEEFQICLTNLLPTLSYTESFTLPQKRDLIPEPLLIYTFDQIAQIFMAMNTNDSNTSLTDMAIQCYRLANEVEELMLGEYFLEGSSLAVLEDHRAFKENALKLLYPIWNSKESENNDNLVSEINEFIFSISERSRSILLLENYQLSTSIQNKLNDEPLTSRYTELKNEIVELEQDIFSHKSKEGFAPEQLDSLHNLLFTAKDDLAKIVNRLMNDSTYFDAEHYSSIVAIKDVQASLTSDRMLIEYFLGKDHFYIIVVTQNDFHIWQKEIPFDFEEKVDSFAYAIKHSRIGNKTLFGQLSFQLHELLLKDVLDWKPPEINRLAIVTDGILGYFPFDLLVSEKPIDNFNYYDLRYILYDYSTSHEPSASLFVLQSNSTPVIAKELFAGFAPKYQSIDLQKNNEDGALEEYIASLDRAGEYDLPGARQEVMEVANLLKGRSFLHEEASEDTFRSVAGNYRILLLSMHSIVNENNPGFSTMLFTKGASKYEDDHLEAIELSNMTIPADLVVLSACNTGFGKIRHGEGIMSLSRAFFSAGVSSILMTLWKVPDQSSSKIITSFFKNIKAGMPKDIALQQAKLKYIKDAAGDDYLRPKLWTGFIIGGNINPIEIPLQIFPIWLLSIFILVPIVFFCFRRIF